MAVVDSAGRLANFSLITGNAAEVVELQTLLDGVHTSEVIADRAYDSTAARKMLASKGIMSVIPSRSNRRVKPWYDEQMYKLRHFVENRFGLWKEFRGLATRYCKLGEMFEAIVAMVEIYYSTKQAETGKPSGGIAMVNRSLALITPQGFAVEQLLLDMRPEAHDDG